MRTTLLLALAVVFWPVCTEAGQGGDWMLRLTLDGEKIEGKPLSWNESMVYLLGRDGRLWGFHPKDAVDFQKSSNRFRSYSPSELRARLLRELGNAYEVSGTTHYLVAHPRGQRDRWAQRFEDLYRSFTHYFSVRGFKPKRPPFLQVGIVCKDRRDFHRFSAQQGMPAPAGVAGYYGVASNRIMLFDAGASSNSARWQENASTVIHEATHQTAFNAGVHSRYTPPPVWVAEGLATMFEAPGVYDSRHHSAETDRVNPRRLAEFRALAKSNTDAKVLPELISSDGMFRRNAHSAYGLSWALTFYLVETQPRKYSKYLTLTASRPPFSDYSAAERLDDFTSVFGTNWVMLYARLGRFVGGLK
ncbi:MAG: DUF1570 domain-containing protein [Candidatus Nealsonbacteria bacterium]|nr:DUF1570 domain-containing protein [Candidatus Nealsonbacteria bacterium]